jgi:hypothetical protein
MPTVARRLRLNPRLVIAVRASGLPLWQLALACGCFHSSRFSLLLHAAAIPDTPQNVALFWRVCDVVKFPHSQAFLDEPQPCREGALVAEAAL